MPVTELLLRAHQCETPADAFRTIAEGLAAMLPLSRATWLDPEGRHVHSWPAGEAGAASGSPERREDSVRIPVRHRDRDRGTLVLEAGASAVAPIPWSLVGEVLGAHADRADRLWRLEEERDLHRTRAEECEALHVLGLAANRTLDPDEVLRHVARFTRTLLGAHYLTVNTYEEDRLCLVASAGLRDGSPQGEDALARRAMEAGKPQVFDRGELRAGADGGFHLGEGMESALAIPLALFGEPFGSLVAGYRRPHTPDDRDIRLALAVAGHAAVAISNARLHRTLSDRSEQLEQAYQELRRSASAKEAFFTAMSHELRTPLNAILGYHQLVLDGIGGAVPERGRGFLENADRAARAVVALVDDILDLSKIEAGKMEVVLRPTRLAPLVREAVATIAPVAREKGLEIRLSRLEDLPEVTTDRDRLAQILVNLLSNAAKFTDAGWIEVSGHADPGGVNLRVRDTGSGIPATDLERVFLEFEQVRGGVRGGTGLGLPISRRLARLLGGELTVESELGSGSTFTLRLPR